MVNAMNTISMFSTLPKTIVVFFLVVVIFAIWMPLAVNADSCLSDEFTGSALDGNRWDVFKGNPTVNAGSLTLAGISGTRADIQSKTACQYGALQASITSSDWKPQHLPNGSPTVTDSDFGFENFTGTNGQCHYAVILVANGNLGLLRAVPDAQGNCSGDPVNQTYIPISNWDAVRTGAGGTIHITLTWTPNSVKLYVSDGGSNSGEAYIGTTQPLIPAIPLKIRLNADCKAISGKSGCTSDTDEAYNIDYIHVRGVPRLTLVLTGCTNCKAGDTFSVSATAKNPTSEPMLVELKAGVNEPDGTEVNISSITTDKHFEVLLPAGLDTSVELLHVLIPSDLQKGTWSYEAVLLSPDLGHTLARDAKIFTFQ